MNITKHQDYFSVERFKRYMDYVQQNDVKAIYLYKANISLSEALYTPLSILEVALRNKISIELERKYGRNDWYAEWYKHPILRHAWKDINNAIYNLHGERKTIQPDKVIAALMFGFWTSLFNDRYERELWADLRFVFPNMPKAKRQRKNISSPLNDIRKTLRNRVYHNEPIIFNTATLTVHYNNITQLLEWMGPDLFIFNNSLERFTSTLAKVNLDLSTV